MGTSKTCRLSLFTWKTVESKGRKEVVPVCPTHGNVKGSSRDFGNGIMFICQEGKTHLLNHCTQQQFEDEREEATAKLYPKAARAAGAG